MMRWMASEYFAQSPVLILPVIALVLFVGIFVAITVRALRLRSEDVARFASLPLDAHDGPATEDRTEEGHG